MSNFVFLYDEATRIILYRRWGIPGNIYHRSVIWQQFPNLVLKTCNLFVFRENPVSFFCLCGIQLIVQRKTKG